MLVLGNVTFAYNSHEKILLNLKLFGNCIWEVMTMKSEGYSKGDKGKDFAKQWSYQWKGLLATAITCLI